MREWIKCDAVIEGERVAQEESGRSSFNKLVSAVRLESSGLVLRLRPGPEALRPTDAADRERLALLGGRQAS
jgi:hypothetical protein